MTEPDDLQPADDGEDDDTEFATIAGAATIQEAKRKALDQLRKVVPYVNEADVDFVVMGAVSYTHLTLPTKRIV